MLDVADSQINEVGDACCVNVLEEAAQPIAGSSVATGEGALGDDESVNVNGSNHQGVTACNTSILSLSHCHTISVTAVGVGLTSTAVLGSILFLLALVLVTVREVWLNNGRNLCVRACVCVCVYVCVCVCVCVCTLVW